MKHLIFWYYLFSEQPNAKLESHQIRVLLADLTGAHVSIADWHKCKLDELLFPRLVCHSDMFIRMAGADEPALVGR